MDIYEGVSSGSYVKHQVDVVSYLKDGQVDDSNSIVRCLVYIDPGEMEGIPWPEYIQRINAGLRDANLPPDWVDQNIRPLIPVQDM